MKYYYINGNMGITSSGSFTKDKTRWITFTENEIYNRPYNSTKQGVFININKF